MNSANKSLCISVSPYVNDVYLIRPQGVRMRLKSQQQFSTQTNYQDQIATTRFNIFTGTVLRQGL